MVPEKFENLLVAGRSISATHVAMSSMRVQATCFALGQAAGAATAISLDESNKMNDISIHKLHAVLELQGVKFIGR
jgi:hypothetical protein